MCPPVLQSMNNFRICLSACLAVDPISEGSHKSHNLFPIVKMAGKQVCVSVSIKAARNQHEITHEFTYEPRHGKRYLASFGTGKAQT